MGIGGGVYVSLVYTITLKENERHRYGKIFLDSCKILIIHTSESNFWKENMYHYFSVEGYFQ